MAMKFHEQAAFLSSARLPLVCLLCSPSQSAPAPAGFFTRSQCPLRMPPFLAQKPPPVMYRSAPPSAQGRGGRRQAAIAVRGRWLSIAFRRQAISSRSEAEGWWDLCPRCFSSKKAAGVSCEL